MNEYEDFLVSALTSPDRIMADADFDSRECFYKRCSVPEDPDGILKIVVAYDDDSRGTVITAFVVDRPKSGEKHLWP